MASKELPTYAVFDDYRYSQRIAVVVRWFLLAIWFFLQNYRPIWDNPTYFTNNGLAAALSVLNGYVHWRIWKGRPITWPYVIALGAMDLTMITAGIWTSSGFGNTFFVLYYPALLGLSLVSPSRRISFTAVTVVSAIYAFISLTSDIRVDFEAKEEKILVIRIAAMYAVVAAGDLMTRIERNRRREAVEAERARSEENLRLQRKAQEAELVAHEERQRIAREIHDGIAQSIYALSLNLETCAELADRYKGPLSEQLHRIVPLAKKTVMETRHYIYDLKPLLSGETDLRVTVENQVKEFGMVAAVPVDLDTNGQPVEVSLAVASGLYRILQEALANILKHAHASRVKVALSCESGLIELRVHDNGVGIDMVSVKQGYGLDNMRQRAQELGGEFRISGKPERGTDVCVTLPIQGGAS